MRLIGDYDFSNHPEDVDLLEKVSGVAASAFCPFISAASPQLFGFDEWTELSKPRDLRRIFDSAEYTKWKSFRESEDSRFCVMTMPRTLARLPYGANTKTVDEFDYEEVPVGAKGESVHVDHNQFCWMNTAYVMGAKLTDAFAKTGFCTTIRGVENGGKVEGLPSYIFKADDGDMDLKCPTEVAITDRREKELSDLGFPSAVSLQEHGLLGLLRRTDVSETKNSMIDRPPPTTPRSALGCHTSWRPAASRTI